MKIVFVTSSVTLLREITSPLWRTNVFLACCKLRWEIVVYNTIFRTQDSPYFLHLHTLVFSTLFIALTPSLIFSFLYYLGFSFLFSILPLFFTSFSSHVFFMSLFFLSFLICFKLPAFLRFFISSLLFSVFLLFFLSSLFSSLLVSAFFFLLTWCFLSLSFSVSHFLLSIFQLYYTGCPTS